MPSKHNGPRQVWLHHSDCGSQYASDAYRELLRSHGVVASMSRARTCEVQALQTFAGGVPQDLASIKAALTTGGSNAQTEGHVNKLKLRKRQMDGRAKFDLLRRRLLLPS